MREVKNLEVKMELFRSGVPDWRLADRLRIKPQSLERKFRSEMSEKEKIRVVKAIHELSGQ
ncbi:MAG: hypothetical protein ACOX8R_02945 [Bacillota bacterium]|jgi:hypothetical protein